MTIFKASMMKQGLRKSLWLGSDIYILASMPRWLFQCLPSCSLTRIKGVSWLSAWLNCSLKCQYYTLSCYLKVSFNPSLSGACIYCLRLLLWRSWGRFYIIIPLWWQIHLRYLSWIFQLLSARSFQPQTLLKGFLEAYHPMRESGKHSGRLRPRKRSLVLQQCRFRVCKTYTIVVHTSENV